MYVFTVILLFLDTTSIGSQAEEFVVGLFSNHPDAELVPLLLLITTTESSSVLVTVKSQSGIIATETINPNEITELFIANTYMVYNASERYKGLVVQAENGRTISVSVSNHHLYSSDSFLALPLIKYYNVNEYTYYALTPDFNSSDLTSRVLIVGGSNDTNVTITPTQIIYIPEDLSPTGEQYELLPSETVTIKLNRFETLLLESESTLSGTKVVTNKPVTFLSGHQCAVLPGDTVNGSCDFAIEQFPPTLNWGKTFIFPLLYSRLGGTYLSILASEPSTSVSLLCTFLDDGQNSTEVSNIANPGDFVSFLVAPDNVICSVTSNKPVLIAILATSESTDGTEGDPLLMMIPPTEQYSSSPISYAPISDNFTNNYLNLAITGRPSDVLIDGEQIIDQWTLSSVFTPDRSLLGYGVQLNTTVSNHTISVTNSSTALTGWIYGFDFSVGYGQSLSMNLLLTGKCVHNSRYPL